MRRQSFHKFLSEKLGEEVSTELLPRRLRILGHVAILWLDPRIDQFKSQIGQAVLEFDSKIQSVLSRTAAISGPFRQPALELIAGTNQTETAFKENHVIFHLDPMKVMFSLGNKGERLRMSKMGTNEFVVDMFAGVGQFSLPMAVHARSQKIHAIEWNPDAYHYLKKNIKVNKVSEIVEPHFGDAGLIATGIAQGKADRVLMGLIQGTTKYLKQGISCLRPNGIIHIHEIGPKGDMVTEIISGLRKTAHSMNRKIKPISTHTIKTYNPQYNHFVIDVQIIEK